MAYAAASDVAAICLNLLDSSASFDASTVPTSTQVGAWLSGGCSLINTHIGTKGYSAIPVSSVAYELATTINANYAAWQAELSRVSARSSESERTKADRHREAYRDLLKELDAMDLSTLGVSMTSVAYAGGISEADKDIDESNTDVVHGRFSRGMFDNPEGIRSPSAS